MYREGRMSRGWRLAKESWNVIERDRSLLALPLLSAAATVLAGALIFVPGVYFSFHEHSHVPLLVAAGVAAYPLTFLSTYFSVAFIVVARARLTGEQATVRTGIAAANERLGTIAAWSLVLTLFGVVLQTLQRLPFVDQAARIVGILVALVLQTAWSLATYFVVPALAVDNVGPREAMRLSVQTFRKRWGETVTGGVVIGASFGLLVIPIAFVAMIGIIVFKESIGAGSVLIAIAVGLFLIWSAAELAVSRLFSLALYEYANGRQFDVYDTSDLDDAFHPRQRRGPVRRLREWWDS
jgi:Family of unknown function (DUF6159)